MTLENPSEKPRAEGALTPTEQRVANLWCEIMQSSPQLSHADNFFALGGDSLAMTMVVFRIQEMFGVELETSSLMEAPELGSFAALIDSALLGADQAIESNTP
jgi:acyl carrier protein